MAKLQRIGPIRAALARAERVMGPESRRILENARRAGGRALHVPKGDAGTTLEALEDFGDYALTLPADVYLLLALEQLTDIVEELER